MPAKQKSADKFLIPCPRYVKKCSGRLVLYPAIALVQSRRCEGNPVVESVIQKEIAERLGLKTHLIPESPAVGSRADTLPVLYLDVLPLPSKATRQYGLDESDMRVLAHRYGQGYVIKTDRKRLYVIGSSVIGLLYALMTLAQLFQKGRGGKWEIPAIHIRDYPDVEYRALDWLLNAECNRWCYDWGDGPQKVAVRIKRRLDMCLAYKINMVHLDGLGWGIKRTPGYAALMRDLNAYARARGILLMAGGCGGGYGFSYQVQFKKQGKYWGRLFYNRAKYPAGKIYSCQGNPIYEGRPYIPRDLTRKLGTCLSNSALRRLKLKELVNYVRKTEPGSLYIHDMDTGDYRNATLSWKMRCARCRRKWPSDKLESKKGTAGAYAGWFSQVRREISKVHNASGYHGRDCRLVFTSPLYTEVTDSDATWEKEITYFRNVSALMPAGGNVLFGIREQIFKSKNEYRVAQLGRVLAERRHGCMMLCVAGGDLYTNDHIFTPLATLAKVFEGAMGVSLFNGHVHQEAVQVLDANYLWNVNAPGSDTLPADQGKAAAKFDSFRTGKIKPEFICKNNGLLDQTCRRLFGAKSGRLMSALYRLKSKDGYGPTTVVWFPFTRRLWNGVPLFDKKFGAEWCQRLAVNQKAERLVAGALKTLEGDLRVDLEWLQSCLVFSRKLLELLVNYAPDGSKSRQTQKKFQQAVRALRTHLDRHGKFVLTDPEGGDVNTWKPALQLLEHVRVN